jgi:hypothetical protein
MMPDPAVTVRPSVDAGLDNFLLLGVISVGGWALDRRVRLRALLHQNSDGQRGVHVRFFMADGEASASDRAADDVVAVRLPVSANLSVSGKYFLQNALLRHAHAMRYRFAGRLDDDALVNLSAVTAELHSRPIMSAPYIVYSPLRGAWYMWHTASMMPACKSFSPRRYERAAPDSECRQPGLVGPFVHPAGAFAIFSMGVVRRLIHRLDADESHVLLNRSSRRPALNPYKRRVVSPDSSFHPSRSTLLEDVNLGRLLYEEMGGDEVLLVHVRQENYIKRSGSGGGGGGGGNGASSSPSPSRSRSRLQRALARGDEEDSCRLKLQRQL